MLCTVRLYYETGLEPNNCMDSLALLDVYFTYRDFNNIAVKQNRGLINIQIDTTYDLVANADYCKIEEIGYWISGITMLNDNVAQLMLQQDYITTVGISNFSIISGWCTRRCVTDDTLFSNIIPENFQPMEELQLDGCNELQMTQRTNIGTRNVLVASIDIRDIQQLAATYADASTGEKIVIPVLPTLDPQDQTKYLFYPNGQAWGSSTDIPLTAAFNPNTQLIYENIARLRSLGIESCISASYTLPKMWMDNDGVINETNGLYGTLVDNHGTAHSLLYPKFGSYKNNKVYSGQFQSYIIYSLCSGEMSQFKVEDILDPLYDPDDLNHNKIDWYYFADLRYNGYPSAKPLHYKGNLNDSMFGVIKGAGWQQTPFMYSFGQSGYLLDALNIGVEKTKYIGHAVTGALDTAVNLAGTAAFLGDPNGFNWGVPESAKPSISGEGGLSAVEYSNLRNSYRARGLNQMADRQILKGFRSGYVTKGFDFFSTLRDFRRELSTSMAGSPDIQFPVIPQLQDFLGNRFYEMRLRLTDNDMQRFDKYLTMYGYAVFEPLTSACLTGRDKFNFVMAKDVDINSDWPLYIRKGICNMLELGVRIWHIAPTNSAYDDNPISQPT